MLAEELLADYDILLVDMYGVFWSGTHVFPAAIAAMERLMAAGKEVIILSNASLMADVIAGKCSAHGLRRGVHFSDLITSGTAMCDLLGEGKLHFRGGAPKKYFVYGAATDAIFAKSALEKTENLDESDFVYVSIVRFSDAERERMPDHMRQHLYVAHTGGNEREWDSISIDPYIPQLKVFLEKKKPILVANPDKFAICAVLETPDAAEFSPKAVVKQGSLAEAYGQMGGEVFAVGKPFPRVYRHALEKLSARTGEELKNICQKRIAMIGDSIDTDILGAKNASKSLSCRIDGLLVLTGVFAGSAKKDPDGTISIASMEKFFLESGIRPDHVISAFDMDAAVVF
jgi:HAD superfamily hydrolase (TIGR01450 family)